MFSIVSMQEVLINLNGANDLFKLFEGPRSKKRSVPKAIKEKPPLFTVKQVWILPSHIMILTQNSQKLIAFDQLPRLRMQSKDETDLLSPLDDCGGGVLDIFHVLQQSEYIIVLLKNGDMVVWNFTKPLYEWNFLSKLSLSKCQPSKIISYIFDECTKTIIWCEKRTSTYCHIFSARVVISESSIVLSDVKTILHNSLPMNIYQLPDGCCFIPAANKPPGLLLCSSNTTDVINVHMWSDGFNRRYIPTTSSDFQAIITSCISLWIHSPINENRFISIATHPSTKQLLVLQNDLRIYLIGGQNKKECHDVVYLCTLEVTTERETFSKQILKIFPYQRQVLLVMSDGVINIFDTRGGLFLWKTETFRNNAPRVWVRLGSLPTIGMWNRSGIWTLRPQPINEQVRSFHQAQMSKEGGTENKTANIPTSVEMSADVVVDGQIQKKNINQRRKIKQGVNRSTEIPTRYIFQILNQWQLTNLSTDIAVTTATRIKETLRDEESEEEIHMEEMISILEEIKDPVILVVLFSDRELPYTIRKRALQKLDVISKLHSSKHLSSDVSDILKEYCDVGRQVDECYINVDSTKSDLTSERIIKKELTYLESTIQHKNSNVMLVDRILYQMFKLNSKYFMDLFLSVLLPHDALHGTYFECKHPLVVTMEMKHLVWKAFLRFESLIFERTCFQLWLHEPQLLHTLTKEVETTLRQMDNDGTSVLASMDQITTRILTVIWLPMPTKHSNKCDEESTARARIYCQFMLMRECVEKDESAYDILLHHLLFDDALTILEKYADDTQRHLSLFYQMVVALLRSKTISMYADRLRKLIPKEFNIAEICNVFLSQASGGGSGQLFQMSEKHLSIGMVKPLLEEMLG